MAKAPSGSTRKKTPAQEVAADSESRAEEAVVIEETPADKPAHRDETQERTQERQLAETEVHGGDHQTVTAAHDAPAENPQEPAAEAVRPSAAAAHRSRSGAGAFVGFLLGGVAAAVVGFGAARYVVPEGWPFPGVPPEEDPIASVVAAQGAEIAALSTQIDVLGVSVSTLQSDTAFATLEASVTAHLDRLGQTLTTLTDRFNEIEARLAAVEKLAPEGSAAAQMAAEAYERELSALREMFSNELERVEAAQADAEVLEEQAALAALAAAGRAALSQVTAALDSGKPFDDALQDLTGSTGIAAPEALASVATEGVPTLAALQEAFPPAARTALDASVRAAVDRGEISRFAAFVQTQLGARSLEPKEGTDADAVLSRAEAALRQGDLGAALAELGALPEAGQPAMAEWRDRAAARKAALDAGAALAQELNPK